MLYEVITVGSAEYLISDNEMAIKVKRSLFGLDDKDLNFEFKWGDNNKLEGNIINFYVYGDVITSYSIHYTKLYDILIVIAQEYGFVVI